MKKNNLTDKEQESLKAFQSFKTTYPNIYRWLITIAIITVAVPFFIWGFFLFGNKIWGISTNFSAGEVLGFYGTFLAFLGTAALGALALWQNKKIREQSKNENDELKRLNKDANTINSRLLDIQQAQYMPIIDIDNDKPHFENSDNRTSVTITFKNRGHSDIKYFVIEKMSNEHLQRIKQEKTSLLPGMMASMKAIMSVFSNLLYVENQEYQGKADEKTIIGLMVDERKTWNLEIEHNESAIGLKIKMINIYGHTYCEIITFDLVKSDNINNRKIENKTLDIEKETNHNDNS